jgi:phosphatidylinositol alpha-1,6-mannosyltransferase
VISSQRNPLKVLVLAPPLGGTGGIQRYTQTLVHALNQVLGCKEVRCCAVPEGRGKNSRGQFDVRAKLEFALKGLWQAVKWQPNLIICTHLAVGPIGWLARRVARIRYWIVVHGIEGWAELPKLKRIALYGADRLLVTSTFSKDQLQKRHAIKDECVLRLPCAVDDSILAADRCPSAPLRNDWGGKRLVLTVGRMASTERYKGHDIALRALPSIVDKIPNLIYVVVGEGDDRPRLEGQARDLGVADHVVFTGEVSDAELAAFYRRAEIFLLPARTVIDPHHPKGEGFGIVFLEAMAFGKPVIGPDYGAPAELIRDGECGLLVDPENPAAVAQALLRLLSSPDLAKRMGESARQRIRKHYSFDSFCRRLKELLADAGYAGFCVPSKAEAIEMAPAVRGASPGVQS